MADKKDWKRLTILIDPEKLKSLKQKALNEDTTVTELLLHAIDELINK